MGEAEAHQWPSDLPDIEEAISVLAAAKDGKITDLDEAQVERFARLSADEQYDLAYSVVEDQEERVRKILPEGGVWPKMQEVCSRCEQILKDNVSADSADLQASM